MQMGLSHPCASSALYHSTMSTMQELSVSTGQVKLALVNSDAVVFFSHGKMVGGPQGVGVGGGGADFAVVIWAEATVRPPAARRVKQDNANEPIFMVFLGPRRASLHWCWPAYESYTGAILGTLIPFSSDLKNSNFFSTFHTQLDEKSSTAKINKS